MGGQPGARGPGGGARAEGRAGGKAGGAGVWGLREPHPGQCGTRARPEAGRADQAWPRGPHSEDDGSRGHLKRTDRSLEAEASSTATYRASTQKSLCGLTTTQETVPVFPPLGSWEAEGRAVSEWGGRDPILPPTPA